MPANPNGQANRPDPGKRPAPAKAAAASPYTGRVVARCRVGDRLGRGATSHVFRALYEPLNKDVALKILGKESAGSAELRTRFLSEARAVAKISHENIVKVIDVVEDQGLLCILMELVAGPTLQDRLDDENVIPPRQAFRIAAQIARALEAAHGEKIVHRDVKPANVMLVGPEGDETVKVVDFGLAVQQEMNRVGTPLFMSPEAAQGKRIDEKSDVYALGICLYRMLTGVLPFTGATVKEILAAQVNAELVPPSEQRPILGKSYDGLLKKLLVKSKGYRPTAGEAAELLEDIADELEEREMGVRRERRRKKRGTTTKKKSSAPLFAGLAVAAVVAVALAFIFRSGDAPPPVAPTQDPASVKTTTPAAPVVDPWETEYKDVEAWCAEKDNSLNRADQIRKWKAFLAKCPPSSKWAEKAKKNLDYLKNVYGGDPDAPQRPVEPTRTPAPSSKSGSEGPAVKLARIQDDIRNFDFAKAVSVLNEGDGVDAPPGVDQSDWDRKPRRLKYLDEHWFSAVDAGLKAMKQRRVSAKGVFADAKDGEILVGANHEGLAVAGADGNNPHTVKWSTAKVDALFQRGVLVDTALDTNDLESNLVLAALAVETGQTPKTVDRFLAPAREMAGKNPADDETVKALFGGGGE